MISHFRLSTKSGQEHSSAGCQCDSTGGSETHPGAGVSEAEAARRAELQRQNLLLEQQRKDEEERRKQEEFRRQKLESIKSLKGVPEKNSGLKGLAPEEEPKKQLDPQFINTAAWQQRQCATEIKEKAKKILKTPKLPINLDRLQELNQQVLDVLQGKKLEVECSIKQILNLGDQQPKNAEWVPRYQAELQQLIDKAIRLNQAYEQKQTQKLQIPSQKTETGRSLLERQKDIVRQIAALHPPTSPAQQDAYYQTLHRLNQELEQLVAEGSQQEFDQIVEPLAARLQELQKQAASSPDPKASESVQKQFRERQADIEREIEGLRRILDQLQTKKTAPAKGLEVKQPPSPGAR